MRRWPLLVALVVGCGPAQPTRPNNFNPARYGTWQVAIRAEDFSPLALPVIQQAVEAMDALGPDFVLVDSLTSTQGFVVGRDPFGPVCGTAYAASTRTLSVGLDCFQTDQSDAVRNVVAHAIGHIVGMGHIDSGTALMNPPQGETGQWSPGPAGFGEGPPARETGLPIDPTALDIAEFQRVADADAGL